MINKIQSIRNCRICKLIYRYWSVSVSFDNNVWSIHTMHHACLVPLSIQMDIVLMDTYTLCYVVILGGVHTGLKLTSKSDTHFILGLLCFCQWLLCLLLRFILQTDLLLIRFILTDRRSQPAYFKHMTIFKMPPFIVTVIQTKGKMYKNQIKFIQSKYLCF